ncbi:hypothetical protein V501_07522 [Pseudogymnoascus sp. VKM F-4519 (FW-2642)]|nr:hypothetical protein V501_07522 [Pseudogymnoascus sp. VKM F-4519 (FW-2642)]
MAIINGKKVRGLSLESLTALKSTLETGDLLREVGGFSTFRIGLRDDEHEYRLDISRGLIHTIHEDAPHAAFAIDFTISAPSEAWTAYLQPEPAPEYSDLICMVTEKRADISGDSEKLFQNLTFVYGMMRVLGHRGPLAPELAAQKEYVGSNGHIEEVIGRYVHVEVEGHIYRTFFEENGPKDAIPVVCLHSANADARAYRHQLADYDYTSKYRMIAFDMPWHARSLPPQELLRSGYLLTNSFYRQFVRAFCEALRLERPIVIGCSMGGYIAFYLGYHDADYYRALISVAGRDYEPRRWALEAHCRNPAMNFSHWGPNITRGFMAPTDPVGCADEVAFLYETGSPRCLRGDLNFAARDCDARPFMHKIDTEKVPFYILGGEYDWSCTEKQTDEIKSRMPGANVVRMKCIGHFPPDENPDVFKSYVLPVLAEAIQKSERAVQVL